MNILEICSGAEVNGAVIHCLLLTRSLAQRGHRVTLLCRPNAFIAKQLAGDNVEIVTSDMHRWPLDELRRIACLCRERDIQIIHTHMTRAHNFGVFLRRFAHIPCVATAHTHLIQPQWMFNDHVIAVSDATGQFQRSRSRVRAERIETVHGFMDFGRFANVGEEARRETRKALGIDEETPLLAIIGDIIPRKGLLHLVRALPKIIAAVPNVRLAIVGEPKRGTEYYEKARAEARKLNVNDHILWLGQRRDVPQIMAALDVYILASLDEMFPVAVLEAMAAGKAIVATRVGGVPESVREGQTGLLVPPENADALADAILKLLMDAPLRSEMGARAREAAQNDFSVESQTPRLEAVFARVIDRSRKQRDSS